VRGVTAVSEGIVTLQEAADRLKVHYMTAYRWVRRGELPAFKVGGRLRVRERDLEAFMDMRAVEVAMPSVRPGRTDWPAHCERLHELLRDGAAAEASALVRRVVTDGATVGDVYVYLMTPARHRIGDDWAHGRITVADEHRATEIARTIIARLGESFRRRGPARATVVTLTPPDELHALASVMLADVLRGGGFEVHQLGPNVPLADLELFLQVTPSQAACVSVTRTDLEPSVLAAIVAAAERAGAPAVLGGQGVDPDLARRWGATLLSDLQRVNDVIADVIAQA
jgi:MerR family transcriptional regulator, light-induced transcriptional regulator